MRQRANERLISERLRRGDSRPGIAIRLAVAKPQQQVFDIPIDAVDHAVAVHVAQRAAIPNAQLRGLAELETGRLEREPDLRGVDVDGDEYGIADRHVALSGRSEWSRD